MLKDAQTIRRVLAFAHEEDLPLPVAVESYRDRLRAEMRRCRKLERELRFRGRLKMAEYVGRRIEWRRAESRRVRRLQLRFGSWRGAA